jgi:LysM repeat protein
VDSEPAGPAVIEPEPVSAPTVASSASRTHRVQRGETLQSISSEYYGTVRRWRSIADANSIGEYDLQIGMELTIPGEQPAAAPAAATGPAAAAAPAAASSGRKYTVKDGDSYYTIARDQLGNAGRFKELEKLAGIPARDLRVGTVITLPATGAARTSGSPSTTRSPATTTSIPAGAKVHVVRDGETLGAISRRHLGTSSRWREIAKANGISDAANLRVGQKLVIPGVSTTGSSAAAATTPAASTGSATTAARGEGAGTWHTIARGDTLQAISQRYFGTTRRHGEIKRANPGLNDRRLVIGAKLWIPGAESTGSSSAPAASPAAASRPAQPEPVSPPPVESPSQPASGGSGVDWNALP